MLRFFAQAQWINEFRQTNQLQWRMWTSRNGEIRMKKKHREPTFFIAFINILFLRCLTISPARPTATASISARNSQVHIFFMIIVIISWLHAWLIYMQVAIYNFVFSLLLFMIFFLFIFSNVLPLYFDETFSCSQAYQMAIAYDDNNNDYVNESDHSKCDSFTRTLSSWQRLCIAIVNA